MSSATAAVDRRYRRKLSRVERTYVNARTLGANTLIRLVVDGVGSIEPAAFDAAVAAASSAAPGLSVRRRGATWHGGGPAPVVAHLPIDRLHCDAALFHDPIDVTEGPVVRLAVGHSDPADAARPRTRIAAVVDHAVTDGHGFTAWLADVFRELRGEQAHGFPSEDADIDLARRAPKFGKRSAPTPTPEPRPSPLRRSGVSTETTACWYRAELPPVTEPVVGHIVAAVAGSLRSDTGSVSIPVDLRRHSPGIRSTANLSSPVALSITRDTDARSAQSAVLMALMRGRELDPYRSDYRASNGFARSLDSALGTDSDGGHPVTAIISDHGVIDERRFSTASFEPLTISTLPMVVPHASMFVSAVTTSRATVLTLGCRRDDDPALCLNLLNSASVALGGAANAAALPGGGPADRGSIR